MENLNLVLLIGTRPDGNRIRQILFAIELHIFEAEFSLDLRRAFCLHSRS